MTHAETTEFEYPAQKSIPARWEKIVRKLIGPISQGRLTIDMAQSGRLVFEGEQDGPSARVTLNNFRALRKILLAGDIGFFEAYRDGDCSTADLDSLFEFVMLNEAALTRSYARNSVLSFAQRLGHLLRRNSKRGSRNNISYHYDLGNAFYAHWLDRSMTYSSAVFENGEKDLETAQVNKYRQIAKQINIQPGDHVLEIGCGWGGFAEIAIKEFGARITGLTLSKEQLAFAEDRLRSAGLSEHSDLRLQDYRDVDGQYDKIVSIEMFEAVGEAYWPTFFSVVRNRLKPQGSALLQVITIEDRRYEDYRKGADFIQKFIFPGGHLPSPAAFKRTVANSGLSIAKERFFGGSYETTLRQWHDRFVENWPKIAPLGFDEKFKRLWTYYLKYCEIGFRTQSIDVGHFELKPD